MTLPKSQTITLVLTLDEAKAIRTYMKTLIYRNRETVKNAMTAAIFVQHLNVALEERANGSNGKRTVRR